MSYLHPFFYRYYHLSDYLLDDLQASVSRPGSSLGQPITSSHHHQSSSSQHVNYLQPANSTTVLRERSTSPVTAVSIFLLMHKNMMNSRPNKRHIKHTEKKIINIPFWYTKKKTDKLSTVINCRLLQKKKYNIWILDIFYDVCFAHFQGQKKFYTATSKYEYKTSSGGGSSGKQGGGNIADSSVTDVYKQNINQLDNLLSDLERERDSSLDRSKYCNKKIVFKWIRDWTTWNQWSWIFVHWVTMVIFPSHFLVIFSRHFFSIFDPLNFK